jgi:ComF family protein
LKPGWIYDVIGQFSQFLLPSQCQCCERFLEGGRAVVCPDCLAQIPWIEPPFCSICGIPFPSRVGEPHPCSDCMTKKRYFQSARALGSYAGSLQKMIHRWKYQEKTYLTAPLGKWMAMGVQRYWDPPPFDFLLPVPLHLQRLRARGFNQVLLLVRELSRRTGIPYRKKLLQKKNATTPQVELSGTEREKAVRDAFHITGTDGLEGKSILLVDDVYTTGATVNECARILVMAGARRVDVLTLAHAVKRT